MISNLNQLKKALVQGIKFEIIAHCRPECASQVREVSMANSVGFYSKIVGDDVKNVNQSNGDRGPFLSWSKAAFWCFGDDTCTLHSSAEQSADNTILSFRILQDAISSN